MSKSNDELNQSTEKSLVHDHGDDVLCVCFGTTRNDIREHMSRPNFTVDDMIRETKVGTKCTACLLDLDVTLNDIHFSRGASSARRSNEDALKRSLGDGPVEHLDSAIFVCDEGVKTVLRFSNFTPMFEVGPEAVDHTYKVWLMAEDGSVAAVSKGTIAANSQVELDFSQIPGCPRHGWFLISCLPKASGFYGTLRPQGLLVGDHWSSAFHLQGHYASSNSYRRMSIVIKTAGHKTYSKAFIFNGTRKKSDVIVEIDSRESDFHVEYKTTIEGNGMCVVDLDKQFPSLPEKEIMLLTVNSASPTKKYLAVIRPDGQWSADHFPTLP